MTILDRAAATKRIRIDATQLADELARHKPAIDGARGAAASAVHDAADSARQSIDRAAEIARGLRDDLAHAVEKAQADHPADHPADTRADHPADTQADALGRRLRGASTTAFRAVVARGRSRYLIVGIAASVGAGVVAAILLEPKHGKERRQKIAKRASTLGGGLGAKVAGTAKSASERARGIAIERGLIKPPAEPAEEGSAEGAVADAVRAGAEALPVVDAAGAPELVAVASTNGAGANGADAPDHGSTRSISG